MFVWISRDPPTPGHSMVASSHRTLVKQRFASVQTVTLRCHFMMGCHLVTLLWFFGTLVLVTLAFCQVNHPLLCVGWTSLCIGVVVPSFFCGLWAVMRIPWFHGLQSCLISQQKSSLWLYMTFNLDLKFVTELVADWKLLFHKGIPYFQWKHSLQGSILCMANNYQTKLIKTEGMFSPHFDTVSCVMNGIKSARTSNLLICQNCM